LVEEFPNCQIWVNENKTTQQILELKEWYKQNVHSVGEVPVLEIDGKILFESDVCCEFLDASFPGQGANLMPSDPYKAAKVRLGMKFFGNIMTAIYVLFRNQEPEKDAELGQKLHQACESFFQTLLSCQ